MRITPQITGHRVFNSCVKHYGYSKLNEKMLSFWDWSLLVATLLGLAIYYYWRKNQYFKNQNLNYDKPHLVVGSMLGVFLQKQHMIDLLRDVYDKFPGDRYTGMFNFSTPVLLVKDPEINRNIMVKDFDHFVDHVPFTDEEIDPLSGKMLFALTGDRWKEMRNTLTPAFTSSKMRAMLPLMQESVDNLSEYLKMQTDNLVGKDKDYVELDVKDCFTRYTNDVIASCGFGIKTNSLEGKRNTFYEMAKDFTTISGVDNIKICFFFLFPFLTRVFKVQFGRPYVNKFFRELVSSNMKQRENHNIVRHDMIQLLMLAKQGKLHDDSPASENEGRLNHSGKKTDWNDDDITAQVLLFLFAGFETSATLLSFMAYELAVNPDAQKKLQDEIDESLVRTKGVVDYQEIHRLKYLDMVISETLRLWPGAPNLDRICVKPYEMPPQNDTKTNGFKLKKGDIIWVPTCSIHRDPNHFPNPNKFDPERFSDENKSAIKPFTYFPFGSGPRQCIASRFALMEAKVLAVNIFSKYEFIRTEKTPVPMKLKVHLFDMVAEKGFWVGVRRRKYK